MILAPLTECGHAVILRSWLVFGVALTCNCYAKTPTELFEELSASVVVVHALTTAGRSLAFGSGVVTGNGQVVTNCHVTRAARRIQVELRGQRHEASVRFADKDRDLCQLEAIGLRARPSRTVDANRVKPGLRVYAIGAPRGLELSISEGIVSGLRSHDGMSLVQTTAAISPGSSGGGLFDEDGRLVGITTFYIAQGQNLNFALPASYLAGLPKYPVGCVRLERHWREWESLAENLLARGEVRRAIDALLTAVDRWPDDIRLRERLALAYERVGETDVAADLRAEVREMRAVQSRESFGERLAEKYGGNARYCGD